MEFSFSSVLSVLLSVGIPAILTGFLIPQFNSNKKKSEEQKKLIFELDSKFKLLEKDFDYLRRDIDKILK